MLSKWNLPYTGIINNSKFKIDRIIIIEREGETDRKTDREWAGERAFSDFMWLMYKYGRVYVTRKTVEMRNDI